VNKKHKESVKNNINFGMYAYIGAYACESGDTELYNSVVPVESVKGY
jgi:hypothetical protein